MNSIVKKIHQMMRVKFIWSDSVVKISNNIIDSLGWYAPAPILRGDRLKMNKKLKKFTSPKHIFNTLKEIVSLQSNVYILTDERDRNYFDNLRKYYKIHQYFDFDELNAIVSGKEPDNNFLFIIERCIYESAAIKIGTFK
jgi:hypothetical protein